jgi:lipoate-protein ligase A
MVCFCSSFEIRRFAMTRISCRLLPYAVAAGPRNMAADQVLLESAVAGVASLRFYGWSRATLSLGYFQAEHVRRNDEGFERLPFVRRPTGGATLVHHHEVTYALGLPAAAQGQSGEPWLQRMHAVIASALGELGIRVRMHTPTATEVFPGALCFRHFTAGDVLIGAAKIVGSAQRRQRGALLQHGAILLAKSPHTPALPGIQELSNCTLSVEEVVAAVQHELAAFTKWDLIAGSWTAGELRRADQLVAERYTCDSWNRKR